jgi:peptide/nickel transport system substrate-binding protein
VTAASPHAGKERILAVATNADPNKKVAEVFQGQIEKLGFKLNLRLVPRDTEITRFCSVPKQNVPLCPTLGWFKDFTDPQSMLDPTFNGENILQQGNVNWPELDVPAINEAMEKASILPIGKERNRAWARINRMVMEQAPGLPFMWDKTAVVGAKDVQLVGNEYSTGLDLSHTSLK